MWSLAPLCRKPALSSDQALAGMSALTTDLVELGGNELATRLVSIEHPVADLPATLSAVDSLKVSGKQSFDFYRNLIRDLSELKNAD